MSAFTCTTKKIIKHEATIDRVKFMELLAAARYPVTDDAKITMTVPGGGDYSNMTLDIDDMLARVPQKQGCPLVSYRRG